MSDEEDFEEQIRQEKIEELKSADSGIEHGRTRVDEDGTVFEWDADKRAWFPKIDADFIAKYQMSYGADSNQTEKEATPSAPPPIDSPEYYNWYYSHYGQAAQSSDSADAKAHEEYTKYYESYMKQQSEAGDADGKSDSEKAAEQKAYYDYYYSQNYKPEEEMTDDEKLQAYQDYYDYYGNQGLEDEEGKEGEKKEEKEEDKDKASADTDAKAGEKRKSDDKGWFEIEDKDNKNVYVSGLPTDITDTEYGELMAKYGLVMYDPRTNKPKLKLYRDAEGKVKGDGRCCFIKSESVDLCLQFLDGLILRNSTVSVQKAKFEVKGNYDPGKKKKKLTNKEKKKLKEKQEKLFDWRPDLPRGTRARFERIIIIKNAFDPKEFESNAVLINEIRADIREECSRYGECRKVLVHDRHPDGVVAITMKEPEEADIVRDAFKGRWFAKRQITAETWDGKTKYEVKETEEERQKRLKQWEDFLEKGEEGGKSSKDSSKDCAKKAPTGKAPNTSSKDSQSETVSQPSTSSTETTESESKMDTETPSEAGASS